MANMLTYDLMLEPFGILRSEDIHTELEHDLEPGETIALRGRRWLVTDVSSPAKGAGRRAIAREVVDESEFRSA